MGGGKGEGGKKGGKKRETGEDRLSHFFFSSVHFFLSSYLLPCIRLAATRGIKKKSIPPPSL
jgi:hypothetical protein